MMNSIKSRGGFSAIELMVVVAILGVVAAIGIPQYNKFQAKSRQSEAKLALAALFTAEESFRQEWNQFSVSLVNIGFSVQGARLRYVTGFMAGTGCTNYSTALGAPTEATTSAQTWSDGASVNTAGAQWSASISKPATAGTTTCQTTAFTAIAYGNPGQTAADPGVIGGDSWTINQTKTRQNSQSYLGN